MEKVQIWKLKTPEEAIKIIEGLDEMEILVAVDRLPENNRLYFVFKTGEVK